MEIKVRLLNFRHGLWKEKQTAPEGRNSEAHQRNSIAESSMFKRIQKAIPLHKDKVFHSAQLQVSLDIKRRTISTTVSRNAGERRGTRLTVC